MQLSTPEQMEEILKQLPPAEQMAYLQEQSAADVEAWGQWKEAKGDYTEAPAEVSPAPIAGTSTRVGIPVKRMPYIAANQNVADGTPEQVDPQQLAQMQSMAAAVEASQGRPSKEPTPVEGPGPLGGDLGMYLRAGIGGATALPAIPINAMLSMMPYGGDGDAVGQIMDAFGAKRPQNRDERITSDIIAGLTGSGAVMTGGKGLAKLGMKETGEKLAAAPVAQLIGGGAGGAASGTVREEGGSQSEQILAALLAGGVPSATSFGTKKAFTAGVPKQQMQETMANFAEAGDTPTIGQLTGGDKAQGTEAFLAQFYGSSPVIKKKLAQQEDSVLGRATNLAEEVGPVELGLDGTVTPVTNSPVSLGRMIEESYLGVGKPAISAQRQEFAQKLADEVNPRSVTPVENFKTQMGDLTSVDPGAKNLLEGKVFNPDLDAFKDTKTRLMKDLKRNVDAQIQAGVPEVMVKEGLPFEAVRKLKTAAGAAMDSSVFGAQNVSQASQRRIYGALAEDLKAFVKNEGIDAEKAFKEWNEWEVKLHDEGAAIRSVLDKNGGPEKVFKAAFSGTKEGPTIISSVFNNVDESTRRALTSAYVHQMGKTSSKTDPDDFNLGQLFGNYRAMDPEAKDIVIGAKGTTLRDSLDKLNSAAQTILKSEKDFGMKAGGKSGSLGIQAPIYAGTGLLTSSASLTGGSEPGIALFAGLAAMAGTAVGANALARYMVNPKTVKWMAANSDLPPSAMPTAINLLAQEARKSQDPDMIEFARLMEESQQEQE